MTLKKFLKILTSEKSQVSLEYFILFAIIAGLTLISVSTFLPQARTSAYNLFQNAVSRILN